MFMQPLDISVNMRGHAGSGSLKSPHQPRKRWVIPGYDNIYETSMPIAADPTLSMGQMTSASRQANSLQKLSGQELYLTDENQAPSHDQPRRGENH